MRIKTLVALYFWILEFDDVTCIRSIGNHMISSAIWDKSAQVNFSKTKKIARAHTNNTPQVDVQLKTCSVAYLFDSLLKHCGVTGVCKSRYCFGSLQLSVTHYQVLLSSFCYISIS